MIIPRKTSIISRVNFHLIDEDNNERYLNYNKVFVRWVCDRYKSCVRELNEIKEGSISDFIGLVLINL